MNKAKQVFEKLAFNLSPISKLTSSSGKALHEAVALMGPKNINKRRKLMNFVEKNQRRVRVLSQKSDGKLVAKLDALDASLGRK